MKLIRCYIENFGKLKNYSYEFKDGLNVIKKDNGFGKTTFAVFIKSMFYGFDNSRSEDSDRRKYKPWQGGNFGGNIEFEINGKKYRIERFFGNKVTEDTFKLYDLDTNLESKDYTENIGEEIFKINKEGYERSTYIPQGKIQIEMNDSLNAKLGNMLENENDINTSDEAIKNIDKAMKVYVKTGNKGILNEKKERLNTLNLKLENSKSDEINLDTRKVFLQELSQKIDDKTKLKNQKQNFLNKKIEQGRLKAKQETYDNILKKLEENTTKYNKLQDFFKADVPEESVIDDLNSKIIEIEKYKVELNNSISKEEEEKFYELKERLKNITEEDLEKKIKQTDRKTKNKKLLSYIGIAIAVIGVILAILDIFKIAGICAIIIGVIIVVFSLLNNKNENNPKEIIEIVNLKGEILEYKKLKSKIEMSDLQKKDINTRIQSLEQEIRKFLLKYFPRIDAPFADLLKEIMIKKSELSIVQNELESYRKQKQDYENSNDINELDQDEKIEETEENLKTEIKNLEIEIDKLNDEKNQNKNQIEVLENKVDEIAELENDIENLKDEITEINEKYEVLEATKNFLIQAKQSFLSNYLKEMTDEFEKYLKIIDDSELNADVDTTLGVKIDINGSKKEIKYFSAGYKDLIYICMRFGLIKALFKGELPFVILDDPFTNLDDEKTKKSIDLVSEFSKQYQVIYFICNSNREC